MHLKLGHLQPDLASMLMLLNDIVGKVCSAVISKSTKAILVLLARSLNSLSPLVQKEKSTILGLSMFGC